MFNTYLVSRWNYRLIRWGLGGVFIYAGITKLVDPEGFSAIIEAYGLTPREWAGFISIGLPVVEVLAGAGLLFDIRGSSEITATLLLFFTAILGYGIWKGLNVDCGCFAPWDPRSDALSGLRQALYRDIIMIGAVSYLIYWRRRTKDRTHRMLK